MRMRMRMMSDDDNFSHENYGGGGGGGGAGLLFPYYIGIMMSLRDEVSIGSREARQNFGTDLGCLLVVSQVAGGSAALLKPP